MFSVSKGKKLFANQQLFGPSLPRDWHNSRVNTQLMPLQSQATTHAALHASPPRTETTRPRRRGIWHQGCRLGAGVVATHRKRCGIARARCCSGNVQQKSSAPACSIQIHTNTLFLKPAALAPSHRPLPRHPSWAVPSGHPSSATPRDRSLGMELEMDFLRQKTKALLIDFSLFKQLQGFRVSTSSSMNKSSPAWSLLKHPLELSEEECFFLFGVGHGRI